MLSICILKNLEIQNKISYQKISILDIIFFYLSRYFLTNDHKNYI